MPGTGTQDEALDLGGGTALSDNCSGGNFQVLLGERLCKVPPS